MLFTNEGFLFRGGFVVAQFVGAHIDAREFSHIAAIGGI